MNKLPNWVLMALPLVPVAGIAVGGFIHVGALEQKIVDHGITIGHLFELLSQLLNAILGGTFNGN